MLSIFSRLSNNGDSTGNRRRILGGKRNAATQKGEVEIRRIEQFQLPESDQSSSVLFTELPGEVRDLIYAHVLADYEDMTHEYDWHTCYRRPDYFAPRKADTAILRTCQAIYSEAWYLPWTSARQTFYLAVESRKPTKTTTVQQMAGMLALIERLHPDTPSRRKEIQQIQVFAQAWQLEPGQSLSQILKIPHIMPKTVTITLRHTDMWCWEEDLPIHINPIFVSQVQFPSSVTCVEMQFESLERRKAQVDYMTQQAASKWYFKRSDKIHLVPRSTKITRWIGSSTWEEQRWIGDEEESMPGKLSYYMATIVFVPAHLIDDAAGYENRSAISTFAEIHMPHDIANQGKRNANDACITTTRLRQLNADDSTPASEIYHRESEMRRIQ